MNIVNNSDLENIPLNNSFPSCGILMSSYNGEKFIGEQIESILAQIGVNIHIIVRDDGSSDNTVSIIKKYAEQYQGKIQIIQGKNVGIHKSFKYLMESTDDAYDYIAFSDQDDIWDPDKMRYAILSLEFYNSDLYYCASRLVDKEGRELGISTENIEKYKLYSKDFNIIFCPGAQGCTMVMRRKLYTIMRNRGIPQDFGHDTWIPIVANLFYDTVYDPNTHMKYRQHGGSWTGNRSNRISQRCIELKHYVKGLGRYRSLAKFIISSYGDLLSSEQSNAIHGIADTNLRITDKISNLRMFDYRKYGWKENTVFRLYYIMHG